MTRVYVYDTTLRDGTQGEHISLTVEDKLRIAQRLDEFGIDYIEGGWPGSNPKDSDFFARARGLHLRHAHLAAFGSTRRPGIDAGSDEGLRALLMAETPVVTVVGKSWTLHVTEALRTTLHENLEMIHSSLALLKAEGREVIYDAEHFFDGYRADPEYALDTLTAAREAGADWIILCDTNGGALPWEIEEIVARVAAAGHARLGIHVHNDAGTAVASTLAALRAGATQVQGTVNGIGERCGNVDLCPVIAGAVVKLGYDMACAPNLDQLTALSAFVYDVANLVPVDNQPYVGRSAFAHKGGIHVSAVMRNEHTYEHVDPAVVGNLRRVLVSDLSGRSNLSAAAAQMGISLDDNAPAVQHAVQSVKELENRGYQFEAADASLELLLRRQLGIWTPRFTLLGYRVTVDHRGDAQPRADATIQVVVGDRAEHTAAEGDGPVHALDRALRKALQPFFPDVQRIHLTDYRVRVLDGTQGTGTQVRVLIESADEHGAWTTVGVSPNILEASWEALADSIEYGLARQSGEVVAAARLTATAGEVAQP
ncbi:MAG: citramalate synthase [Chloroflexi bacterium]|nr:citramalate synthase [Chloroflexota bacterium]